MSVVDFTAELGNPTTTLTVLRPGGPVQIVIHPLAYKDLLQTLAP